MDSSDSHLSKCTVIRSFASSLCTCANAMLAPIQCLSSTKVTQLPYCSCSVTKLPQIFILRLLLPRVKCLVTCIRLNFKPSVPRKTTIFPAEEINSSASCRSRIPQLSSSYCSTVGSWDKFDIDQV